MNASITDNPVPTWESPEDRGTTAFPRPQGAATFRTALSIAVVVLVSIPGITLLSKLEAPSEPVDGRSSVAPANIPGPVGVVCNVGSWSGAWFIFGPACADLSAVLAVLQFGAGASAAATSQELSIALYNYLNITNSGVANLNATAQELLSYYESRAEAIVPYFLNATWNQTVYDQIAIDSGLVPSIEGFDTAFAQQQFQDWNATVNSWNAIFGSGGPLAGSAMKLGFDFKANGNFAVGDSLNTLATNGHSAEITSPWEYWGAPWNNASPSQAGPRTMYANIAPGGTIACADFTHAFLNNQSLSSICGNYTVFDLNKNISFFVPTLHYDAFANYTGTPVSTQDHLGEFDLLRITCNRNCSGSNHFIETANAFVFENVSTFPAYTTSGPPVPQFINGGLPQMILSGLTTYPNTNRVNVPNQQSALCFGAGATCSTYPVNSGGTSKTLGSGPSSVPGGPLTLEFFPITMQAMVNNTLTMARAYYDVLRALTNHGQYPIPRDCSIPAPSDALPAATDFRNYALTLANLEAVYVSYLDSVARAYGTLFSDRVGFCASPNLGFGFTWTGSWNLVLNITLSVYLGNGSRGRFLNGTVDPTANASLVSTWPVHNVDPALVYPVEYQALVPVGKIYRVPVNNPLSLVLVNYTGNPFYGVSTLSPNWGVPTYAGLVGTGNYTNLNGTDSGISSGTATTSGDAIEVTSCVLNGNPTNPCPISVTYFSSFTIGLVHRSIGLFGGTPSGGLSGVGSDCGFGNLNQFYDAWAGYFGSAVAQFFSYFGALGASFPILGGAWNGFWSGLGCLVGWIVVIFLFLLVAYAAVKIGSFFFGRSRRRGAPA